MNRAGWQKKGKYHCRNCASTWKEPSIPMRFGKAQILHPRSAPPKAIPDSRAFVMPPSSPRPPPTAPRPLLKGVRRLRFRQSSGLKSVVPGPPGQAEVGTLAPKMHVLHPRSIGLVPHPVRDLTPERALRSQPDPSQRSERDFGISGSCRRRCGSRGSAHGAGRHHPPRDQPPFPRPPDRPNGCFRGRPPKANS